MQATLDFKLSEIPNGRLLPQPQRSHGPEGDRYMIHFSYSRRNAYGRLRRFNWQSLVTTREGGEVEALRLFVCDTLARGYQDVEITRVQYLAPERRSRHAA